MKILGLNPKDFYAGWPVQSDFGRELYRSPSLTFPVLRSLTPPEHEMRFIEGFFEPITMREYLDWIKWPDVVGFNIASSYGAISYAVAIAQVKRLNPKATIVAGGHHANVFARRWLDLGVDIVVKGEAERSWPVLVRELAGGRRFDRAPGVVFKADGEVIETENAPLLENLDDSPMPDLSLINFDIYPCLIDDRGGHIGSIVVAAEDPPVLNEPELADLRLVADDDQSETAVRLRRLRVDDQQVALQQERSVMVVCEDEAVDRLATVQPAVGDPGELEGRFGQPLIEVVADRRCQHRHPYYLRWRAAGVARRRPLLDAKEVDDNFFLYSQRLRQPDDVLGIRRIPAIDPARHRRARNADAFRQLPVRHAPLPQLGEQPSTESIHTITFGACKEVSEHAFYLPAVRREGARQPCVPPRAPAHAIGNEIHRAFP